MTPPRRSVLIGMTLAAMGPKVWAQAVAGPRPISDQQLRKVLDLMAAAGAIRPIGPSITSMLGIGAEDQALTCVQLDYRVDAKHIHTIAKLQDQLGYLISYRDSDELLHIYYADNALAFQRAIDKSSDDELTLIPDDLARVGLDGELKFWAKAADADFK